MSITKITRDNPSHYTNIFREDIENYTERDIKNEIWEWIDIIEGLLGQHPTYYINTVKFSSRAEKFLAKTGRSENGRITINSLYFHNCIPDLFHSVIAHEVIHTFPGCFNHGENFKRYGRLLMNRCPHVFINTTIFDAKYENALRLKHAQNGTYQKRWLVECQGCGQQIWREKRCKLVNNPTRYHCGICGGRLSVVDMFD